jgi:invasion protein IalB
MTRRHGTARLALTVLFAAAANGAAGAQTPQQTTATYDDWILRCDLRTGTPPVRVCEVAQFTQVQGQGPILTQISIGAAKKGEPSKVVIQVPIDVWLPAGVRLLAGEKDAGVLATFKRCAPNACFADVDIRDDVVRRLRTSTETGKLQFKDVNQKDVSLPVSFKGFGPAFDALPKD